MLAVRTGLLQRGDVLPVFQTAEEVGRMLTALKQTLRERAAAAS